MHGITKTDAHSVSRGSRMDPGQPTTASGEVAAQCDHAVDLIHDFKVGMFNFKEKDMVPAIGRGLRFCPPPRPAGDVGLRSVSLKMSDKYSATFGQDAQRSGNTRLCTSIFAMRWRSLVGVLVVVAVGCSSGGNEATPISKEVANSGCGQAIDALNEFKIAMNSLNRDDMAQATDTMRDIGASVPGTGLSELIDATRVAMTPMVDFQQNSGGYAERALEFRQSASTLGLWCVGHTSPDLSADLAQRFVLAS